MDILDKLATALRNLKPYSAPESVHAERHEALAEYESVRRRTVVLTFEKAVPIATGGFAILDDRKAEPALNVYSCGGVAPEERDYAFSKIPPLPGPEVFKEETT